MLFQLKGHHRANVSCVVKCLFAVTNGISVCSSWCSPSSGVRSTSPPQSTYRILEAGEASWLDRPSLLWSTNTPAELSLIKMQLQGSCSWLALCVQRFAAMQTCSPLRKIQQKSTESSLQSWNCSLLVSQPSDVWSQRPQKNPQGNL